MLTYPDFEQKTIIVIFSHQGQKYAVMNDNIIIKDVDDNVILQNTCYRTLALWIVGPAIVTSGLLDRSKRFAFPILLLSTKLRCIGMWSTPSEGNFILREKQYNYKGLDIPKHITKNKILNQLLTLKKIRSKTESCVRVIDNLEKYYNQIDAIDSRDTLLGLEGISSKIYFQEFWSQFNWVGRRPRTKIDPINVLLDIGYTFLFYIVENTLNLYGFDLYKGVYHTNFYQRKSLVCDLQEPFRPIVDSVIKKCLNLSQIKMTDFDIRHDQYFIKYSKEKECTNLILKGILKHKKEIFMYCQKILQIIY